MYNVKLYQISGIILQTLVNTLYCTHFSENNHELLKQSLYKGFKQHSERRSSKSQETFFSWNFVIVAISYECCFHYSAN